MDCCECNYFNGVQAFMCQASRQQLTITGVDIFEERACVFEYPGSTQRRLIRVVYKLVAVWKLGFEQYVEEVLWCGGLEIIEEGGSFIIKYLRQRCHTQKSQKAASHTSGAVIGINNGRKHIYETEVYNYLAGHLKSSQLRATSHHWTMSLTSLLQGERSYWGGSRMTVQVSCSKQSVYTRFMRMVYNDKLLNKVWSAGKSMGTQVFSQDSLVRSIMDV